MASCITPISFVQQTGNNKTDNVTRKAIRRHVMLGKNRGRPPKNPKPAALTGAGVLHKEPVIRTDYEIPRSVGSDISFLQLADDVDLGLLKETLRFCAVSSENMFVLEPCISFDPEVAIRMCLYALSQDALYLNVMVFSTHQYFSRVLEQATSQTWISNRKPSNHHYGRALGLLRDRLVGDKISDVTIMSILPLAFQALFSGDLKTAKDHNAGLQRLLSMRQDGVCSVGKTKQVIDILRCDISISLATGQAPLFYKDVSRRSLWSYPELSPTGKRDSLPETVAKGKLRDSWEILQCFGHMINKAGTEHRKLSEELLLQTMSSVMYRLLQTSCLESTTEELLRLAMLCFCASAFLHWRQLRIPSPWLQAECELTMDLFIQDTTAFEEPSLLLWTLMIYGITFRSLPARQYEQLQVRLMQVTELRGVSTWDAVREQMEPSPWIDIICNSPAQKLLSESFFRKFEAIGMPLG